MIDILVISHAAFTGVNREVYCQLVNEGYRVEMVVPSELQYPSGTKKPQQKRNEDPPIHFLSPTSMNLRTRLYNGLIDLLNHKQPGIVLLDNDPASRLSVQVGRWCRTNSKKFVCQSCENLPIDVVSSIKRQGIKGLVLSVLKNILIFQSRPNIDHLFTISNDGTKIFENLGFKSVSKIPLGFNESLFNINEDSRSRVRDQIELGPNKIVVAYFGRIVYEKGIHVLIDALGRLKDLDWILMMDEFDLYQSDYSVEIKELIEYEGLGDRVIYIDADHEEIADYMNASDIVVLPSVTTKKWKEQYGRVVPEAMACGNAVIVSDVGALPELIDECGIKVKEADAIGLSSAISKLITDKEMRKDLGKKANNRAHEFLGVKRQVLEYKKVFEKI